MTEHEADFRSATDINPNTVVLLLSRLARELRKLSDEMDELELQAVTAKEQYTVEYAKTFLDQDGPVAQKEQKTLWLTHDIRLARDIAAQMVVAHKRKMDTLKTRIDVARSAAALVRMEADLLNVRGR